ncbi:MAG: PAS domain-containing protein [Deltaproteobacteria bacterium]
MNISKKLKFAAVVPAVMTLVIGAGLLFSYLSVRSLEEEERAAVRISTALGELNDLARTYALHYDERPLRQFKGKHEETTRLISSVAFGDPKRRRLQERVAKDTEAVKTLFMMLFSNHERYHSIRDDDLFEEAEERIVGQLMIRTRQANTDTSRLLDLISHDIVSIQRRIYTLSLAFMAVAAVPFAMILLGLMRRIAASLDKLQKGADMIGRGDLDHRIGISSEDEIGAVANAFDRMSEKLQAATVSRDELTAEVAQRKRTEAALENELAERRIAEETARHLASFPQLNPNPIVEVDSSGRITFSNNAARKFLQSCGMKDDDISVLVPADLGCILGQWDGKSDSTFYRELVVGGSVIGETVHLVSRFRLARIYGQDITKRKKAEEALLASKEGLERRVAERTAELEASAARIREELEKRMKAEERLERQASLLMSVLDSVGDGVVVADGNGKLLLLNPEGQRIIRRGITDTRPDEWAKRYGIFLPDATTACPTDRIPLVRAIGGESFDDVELFVRHDPYTDGAWISCSGRPLRNADGVLQGGVVAFRDITARKRAEKSLKTSIELTEKIFSNIHFSVVYLDEKFNFLRVNQAYADACGHPPEYFTGKNHFEMYPDAENEAIFRRVVTTGEPFHVHGKPFEYPDHPEWGTTYWDWSLLPLKGMDGDVEGLIFCLVDATERQRSSKALQASEEQFRTLVRSSLVGIMIVRDGRVVYMNPAQKTLFGDAPGSFELRSFKDVHPEDRGTFEELCEAVMSDAGGSREMEFRFYPFGRSDEGIDMRWVHCRGTPLLSQGERVFLLNMVDITRLKEMEHHFLVREKMASLGHVAAGIAHEIRNPLSGINIHLSALEAAIEEDGGMGAESRLQSERIIEQIKSASNRIGSVIKKVMDFVRPGAPRMDMADIGLAVEEAIDFSTTFLRKNGITLDRSNIVHLPKCAVDPSLLTQVVMNLITNAAQAMEGQEGPRTLAVATAVENDRAVICVSDSGPGIPPAIRDRIFDPFYTTRKDGYGIGLSFCRRVITDHGGTLKVDVGRLGGAEFRIEIPLESGTVARPG